MTLGERIRGERKKRGLSQEELADILNVSRQAITKWETDRGIPDIANLIRISEEFEISLDELIKGDNSVKRKIIYDSTMKKWHLLVLIDLMASAAYIAYFALLNRIFMIGFLVATLFMLGFELRIIIKEKRYQKNRYAIPDNA